MAKMQVKRVGVLSYAKINAVTSACVGIIIGVIYGLLFMAVGGSLMAGGGRGSSGAGAGAFVVGLLIMVVTPIFSAVFGFIAGAIGALIYNIAAGFVGGIELELDNVGAEYATPPSPSWGAQQYQPGQQQQYPY